MTDKLVFEDGDVAIVKYFPSLLHPCIRGFNNISFPRRIVRFLLNCLSGAVVYYLKDKSNGGGIIGYCMLHKGKAFHYRYAKADDLTIGPIYVNSRWRGKGLSIRLLSHVLLDNQRAKNVYAYISRTNTPSNALFARMGFVQTGYIRISRFLKQACHSEDSGMEYRLFRLDMTQWSLEKTGSGKEGEQASI